MSSAVQDTAAPPGSRRRSRQAPLPVVPSNRRKMLQLLLVFVTTVLVINALVGERGLMETLRARREYAELEAAVVRTRAENAQLREEIRLLYDPGTIEDIARRELRLIRPGEMLFIIKDARPAPASVR